MLSDWLTGLSFFTVEACVIEEPPSQVAMAAMLFSLNKVLIQLLIGSAEVNLLVIHRIEHQQED